MHDASAWASTALGGAASKKPLSCVCAPLIQADTLPQQHSLPYLTGSRQERTLAAAGAERSFTHAQTAPTPILQAVAQQD